MYAEHSRLSFFLPIHTLVRPECQYEVMGATEKCLVVDRDDWG